MRCVAAVHELIVRQGGRKQLGASRPPKKWPELRVEFGVRAPPRAVSQLAPLCT